MSSGTDPLHFLAVKILAYPMSSTTASSRFEIPPTLLLGGSGRLGRMLRHYWRGQPVEWQSRSAHDGAILLDPLAEPQALVRALTGRKAVICLAGVTGKGANLALNTELACAAIKGAADARVPTVLLASSAAVYGRAGKAWTEEDEPAPVSAYGEAKLDMERQAQALGHRLGVRVCSLRIGNVAGADAILGGWRPGFVLDTLPDGGTPQRSYIGPKGFAAAVASLLRTGPELPDVVNVVWPGSVAMGDLLDAAGLVYHTRPAGPDCIARVILDTELLGRFHDLPYIGSLSEMLIGEWREWLAIAGRNDG